MIREDMWKHQVGDVIEFSAVWVPRPSDYKMDRERLMRLLAGRKNCRDFSPSPRLTTAQERLPKSALDGFREEDRADATRGEGERVKVVGVVPRVVPRRKPGVQGEEWR